MVKVLCHLGIRDTGCHTMAKQTEPLLSDFSHRDMWAGLSVKPWGDDMCVSFHVTHESFAHIFKTRDNLKRSAWISKRHECTLHPSYACPPPYHHRVTISEPFYTCTSSFCIRDKKQVYVGVLLDLSSERDYIEKASVASFTQIK